MTKFMTRAAIAALALTAASVASAAPITAYVFLNEPGAAGNATLGQFAALGGAGAADLTFTFEGTANFTGSGNSTVDTINSFIASGGVAPIAGGDAILNNSYFYFTGTVGLDAGANPFTITHDDGLQLNIDGIGLVVDQPGPTAPVATAYVVNAPTAGNYGFQLSYGEVAGGPAQITVFGGTLIVDAPEPGAIALFGLGTLGVAFASRRRRG